MKFFQKKKTVITAFQNIKLLNYDFFLGIRIVIW